MRIWILCSSYLLLFNFESLSLGESSLFRAFLGENIPSLGAFPSLMFSFFQNYYTIELGAFSGDVTLVSVCESSGLPLDLKLGIVFRLNQKNDYASTGIYWGTS